MFHSPRASTAGCFKSVNRRMQLALEKARECERAAASVTDRLLRAQWLDTARQMAEWARRLGDDVTPAAWAGRERAFTGACEGAPAATSRVRPERGAPTIRRGLPAPWLLRRCAPMLVKCDL
jgi:hypothetical protein